MLRYILDGQTVGEFLKSLKLISSYTSMVCKYIAPPGGVLEKMIIIALTDIYLFSM